MKDLQEFRDRLHSIPTTNDKPREQTPTGYPTKKLGQDRTHNFQRRHWSELQRQSLPDTISRIYSA